jgi:hypothetical protein
MPARKTSIGLTVVLAMFVMATLLTGTRAAAQTETVLYSFNGTASNPDAAPTRDAAGNLYGTSEQGGIWELTSHSGDTWMEETLYAFYGDQYPHSGVVLDAAGNLYGDTNFGGNTDGVVYELTAGAGGVWGEDVLYAFNSYAPAGLFPSSTLFLDAQGDVYGTTVAGGTSTICNNGCGVVFELKPASGGGWAYSVLHSFGGGTGDGSIPLSNLVFDSAGNAYGTTEEGGAHLAGTVYELTPNAGEGWREKVLHSFGSANDGSMPYGNLIFDAAGNLYGITVSGGAYGDGTAFELTPQAGGAWKEKILHSFGDSNEDGEGPVGDLVLDAAGNVYGVTGIGGTSRFGIAFKLVPHADGTWSEEVLHDFGSVTDGEYPMGITIDASGNLYGTAWSGGAYGYGMAFEIKP